MAGAPWTLIAPYPGLLDPALLKDGLDAENAVDLIQNGEVNLVMLALRDGGLRK